ncbi:DUF805 domain-containing protein [Morganella morganii]|jgi:uncharacterized membrane protein YhaH (DUF805 family)|uniref:DUF805 domain-containing protein n=1 Tax=Morganella morganii TaxID=582 RepID=A0AAN5S1F4_MORMO|nr:DUF805 domain-containing protein [Morganella morganii]MCU6226715.1 DUF805 domain-containing protein [Morganella morganii]MCU6235377.1 DUF805 domain-containing protein [Morganella morganii]MCU6275843.1 DUF805 domain-containing protein [Morganella morganii]HAT3810746.1 DUF805 domain-containing protein [Morganella morganii]HED3891232.1 DUF805 domain-containing protein [Morganella morganii]
MDWYSDAININYFNFKGRARRKEYWMFVLIDTAIIVSLYLAILYFSDLYSRDFNAIGFVLTVFFVIYIIVTFIPSLSVTVRRLHDTGRSGWWLLALLIPFGGIIIFVFSCLDSHPGDNRFGPNPKTNHPVAP